MPRTFTTLFALATLSAAVPLFAQTAYSAGPGTNAFYNEPSNSDPASGSVSLQPPAPIERPGAASFADDNGGPQGPPPPPSYTQQRPANHTSEPVSGVWLVTAPDASVQTVSTAADHAELRVEHGRANVNVHHPADHSEILVDLPGGQVSLLKDGLYTFNAETNTVRVLRGEAEVSTSSAKPIKVKEDHQFAFGVAGEVRAEEAQPNQLRADLLQGNYGAGEGYRHGDGYGGGVYPYAPYAYGWPYYGFYGPGWGYPYYAFGYPYGVGLGFGYYGGFRGGYYGGFRGGYGYGGGFRGFRR